MEYVVFAVVFAILGWFLRIYFLNKQVTNLKQEVVDAHTKSAKAEADYEGAKKRVLDIIARNSNDKGGSAK